MILRLIEKIDLIIQQNQLLKAYEIKWSEKNKPRLSKTFSSNYPTHQFDFINTQNIEDYLL